MCCTLSDGSCVGVELTEWLHEGQMRAGKQRERLGESISNTIANVPPNNTANIRRVSMTPKPGAPRFDANDAVTFKDELLALIAEIDQSHDSWFAQGFWLPWSHFQCSPTLGEYLSRGDFTPGRPSRSAARWIRPEPRGGLYTVDAAFGALVRCLDNKTKRYGSKPPGLDEFHLLVHYTQGWSCNTLPITLRSGFRDVAPWASDHIGDNPGPFDRIWLFIPGIDPPQVFRVYARPA